MTGKGAMKVLIMDDSAIVRKRLTAMLSKIVEEENISYAEDATEAINSIQKLSPDALILDMRMPGGNGIDLLLEMKRNDQTLPIIVLTDYPYRQYQRQYVDTGADFFFDKSTEFNQMMAVLRRLGKNSDSDKATSPRSRDNKIDSRKKGDESK